MLWQLVSVIILNRFNNSLKLVEEEREKRKVRQERRGEERSVEECREDEHRGEERSVEERKGM